MTAPDAQAVNLSPFTGKPGWKVSPGPNGQLIGECAETGSKITAENAEGLRIACELAVSRREGRGAVGPTVITE